MLAYGRGAKRHADLFGLYGTPSVAFKAGPKHVFPPIRQGEQTADQKNARSGKYARQFG